MPFFAQLSVESAEEEELIAVVNAPITENEPSYQTFCEREGHQWLIKRFCCFIFQSSEPVILSPDSHG